MAPKVWLVTGSSSGFGLAVVKYVLSKGDKVVATLRKPEVLSYLAPQYPDTLHLMKLDVSKPIEIASTFSEAHKRFGRIDVVYNNAGYAVVSEVEMAPDNIARDLFEVNFWGVANVSKEAVKCFRDVNNPPGGCLIQASSIAGLEGCAAGGHYCATKSALIGLSEAIANEVDPSWNIKVTIIDFGQFKTNALNANVRVPESPFYKNTTADIRKNFTSPQEVGSDPDKAAREIHRIAGDDNSPLHIYLGVDAMDFVKKRIEKAQSDLEKSGTYSEDLA